MEKYEGYYVGFTPLAEIMQSTDYKYINKMRLEAESRLCRRFVIKTLCEYERELMRKSWKK